MTSHFALYAAAAVGLGALCVTAIGYALPQNHVASREAVLNAPPDRVLAIITDVARYPEWRQGVTKVDVVPADVLTWKEHAGSDTLTFETLEHRPGLFRVRIADRNLPYGGTWTYEVTPQGAGSRLRITEQGEVYNPLFRFMSRFVFGHTATIDKYLEALQRRLS
jgi:Polyketide cyclase / dehydrase and lipid transport